MTRQLTLILCLGLFYTIVQAQDISYGFKAGLNFNSFHSDSEVNSAGESVESFSNNTGFHVGAMFSLPFTDLVGARAELLFSQKGGRYKFDGESYYIFRPETGSPIYSIGTRKMNLNITNSYISIPFTLYYRPVQAIEISGGVGAHFLVGSAAFGDFSYSGITTNGTVVEDFRYSLDYKYYTDDPGGAVFSSNPRILQLDGRDVLIPTDAGAYFEYPEDRGTLHKVVDFSAMASLHFFLNKGLFLGIRMDYGLSDFTKTKADVSKVKLDNNKEFIELDHTDRHVSLQASVGFSF